MQPKSVKPQTPALFQMLISLRLLSRSLPGVETLACVGVFSFFSFCLASFLPLFLSFFLLQPFPLVFLPLVMPHLVFTWISLAAVKRAISSPWTFSLSLSHSFVSFCFFSSSSSPPSSSQLRANTRFFLSSSFRGVPGGLKQPHPESRCT